MWLVVISALVAVAWKARSLTPSAIPLHYLFISAAVASALVLILPALLSRISEVSFAGVKVVLAQQELAVKQIEITDTSPEALAHLDDVEIQRISVPFAVKKLAGAQRYHYERSSLALYRIFDQVIDPGKLDLKSRTKYRDLITHVGKAAYAMRHYTKYLNIVIHFADFTDRELNSDEEFMIGHAFLCAAAEQTPANRRDYLEKASQFLSLAMAKSPDVVKVPFNLGMCLFYSEGYERGIELMERCIKLRESMAPWAKWNIAFAQKMLGKFPESLLKLDEIAPGPWWEAIKGDNWAGQPKNADFNDKFEKLSARKLAESKAG